ncbi:hypothetical protein LXL04_003541 [Taraxacum kok-saghyz]
MILTICVSRTAVSFADPDPPYPLSLSSLAMVRESNRIVKFQVLWLDENIVSQVKTPEKEGITARQIGCGHKKEKHLTKPEVGHFRAHGVPLKRKLREFPVTEDALLPLGTQIGVRHFVPGQYVDVTGITKGKDGGSKEGSHLMELHCHIDALVLQVRGMLLGKKMPGRMGGKQRTVKNVWVYKIDPARNLMWVRGQVPGNEGNFVFIKDAWYKKPDVSMLPFLTYFSTEDEDVTCLEPLVTDLGERIHLWLWID